MLPFSAFIFKTKKKKFNFFNKIKIKNGKS